MLFNSLVFLVFAPTVIALYFLLRGRYRTAFCLVSSYVFYGWWDWRFLSLIIGSTLIDFFVGRALHGEDQHNKRKLLLIISVLANLGILATFKYAGFFVESFNSLAVDLGLGTSPVPSLVLPVGISFYTFQSMSYTIDIYRKNLEPEPSLLNFATFVAFFPQLVAGPIVRASHFLPQLRKNHRFEWDLFVRGFYLVLWGYCLKVVVADSLAPVADAQFATPEAFNSLSLSIGLLCYSFQIYGDFCGYSSIAIGVGMILGFDLGENFRRPYFAASFTEFWRRWHISLSSWLRDYLYISLGGNRGGTWKTYRNLVLTMLLGGLWHGAAWGFVLWGALHGLYLVLQRVLSRPYERVRAATRCPQAVSRLFLILLVFFLTTIAWVPFRATSFADVGTILEGIFVKADFAIAGVRQLFDVTKALALIVLLVAAEIFAEKVDMKSFLDRRPAVCAAGAVSLVWALAFLGTYSESAFIYFQF